MLQIPSPHIPVLIEEVIDALKPHNGGKYLDCTFGAGGYSKRILENYGEIYACDHDISTKKYFDDLERKFPKQIKFYHSNFSNIDNVLLNDKERISTDNRAIELDGIVMDLGVSSMQLDIAKRGFSFQKDGPLDMRMNTDSEKTAEDFINYCSFDDLSDIIFYYGDEKDAKKIARKIIKVREEAKITTTFQLAKIIRSVVRFNPKHASDPATKTFQAIRIFINNEMNNLIISLQKLSKLLKIGAKIVIVSFHSTEDRIVKRFFQAVSKKEQSDVYKLLDKEFYTNRDFEIVGKIISPSDEEIKSNIRSRSAKMRVLKRIK